MRGRRRLVSAAAQVGQPAAQLDLEAAFDGLVKAPRFRQVRLGAPGVGLVVAVLVAGTVAEGRTSSRARSMATVAAFDFGASARYVTAWARLS